MTSDDAGGRPDEDPQVDAGTSRSGGEGRPPPGVDALQAAAQEAIDATRALLDVAEALVNDPETARRIGSLVDAARTTITRAATASDRTERDDDGPDDGGVQRIPLS